MFQTVTRQVCVPAQQVNLGLERKRPRQKSGPAVTRQGDGVIEDRFRRADLAPKNMGAPHHGQHINPLFRVVNASRQLECLVQLCDCVLVVRRVAENGAVQSSNAGSLGRIATCQGSGPGEPGSRARVLAPQKFNVPQFAAGSRGQDGRRSIVDCECLMKSGRTFLVAATGGVHQGTPQAKPGPNAQNRIPDDVCIRNRTPQALKPCVENAGPNRGITRFYLRQRGGAS